MVKYIIWDDIKRYGQSDRMYREGIQFGVNHVFTIVGEKNENGSNYYHFASHQSLRSFNYTYLKNLDLLETFILHFKNRMHHSKELSKAYDIKFSIDNEIAGYSIKNNEQNYRSEFLRGIELGSSLVKCLSPQQTKCLSLLLEGKQAKQIAYQLGLSQRTVENYLEIVRKKMGCRNTIELMHKIRTQSSFPF